MKRFAEPQIFTYFHSFPVLRSVSRLESAVTGAAALWNTLPKAGERILMRRAQAPLAPDALPSRVCVAGYRSDRVMRERFAHEAVDDSRRERLDDFRVVAIEVPGDQHGAEPGSRRPQAPG